MGLSSLPNEISAIRSLMDKTRRKERKIVFYSESSIYYLYYESFIEYLLSSSNEIITYITSDPGDPVFKKTSQRFRTLFISNAMMAFTTGLLDADNLLFTMTDLDNFHIKRSTKKVEHIYIFHAIMSTHMIYRKEAFDHYDTIFCVGPHHSAEIRAREKYYGLKEKRLVEVGYPLLEKLHSDHRVYRANSRGGNEIPVILIAPTWSEGNMVDTCIDELIEALLEASYRVVLRPHPETYKQSRRKIRGVIEKYRTRANFGLETALTSVKNIHRADLLITDWSGIALEYAFGTERPVLFVNTPKKIHNSEYEKIGIDPIEVTLRGEIGLELELNEIPKAGSVAKDLLSNKKSFSESIIRAREKYIYNWGYSTEVGSKYILQSLQDESRELDRS